jgi:3-phosphoshikimate 1-carboxyvinyltransferase
MLSIEAVRLTNRIDWKLPPSKSHMIRWLMLSSQTEKEIDIKFDSEPGDDIKSMKECLKSIGVEIRESNKLWTVKGVSNNKFVIKKRYLNCGNSGTTANFITALVANLGEEFTIDGDESLRNRDFTELNNALRSMGCEISSNKLPFTINGPLDLNHVCINMSITSQPLSALILASPTYEGKLVIDRRGESVSRGYSKLTLDIASECGMIFMEMGDKITVNLNSLVLPDTIEIPKENSLIPIVMLLSELHGVDFITNKNKEERFLSEAIEALKGKTRKVLDLRDCSDLITPAAALLAIREGGKIIQAKHARGKESDRIKRTVNLLDTFGMKCEASRDGIIVEGYQIPKKPKIPIETYLDHRIAMTAMALASYTGGKIVNAEISSVTDPEFMEKIKNITN